MCVKHVGLTITTWLHTDIRCTSKHLHLIKHLYNDQIRMWCIPVVSISRCEFDCWGETVPAFISLLEGGVRIQGNTRKQTLPFSEVAVSTVVGLPLVSLGLPWSPHFYFLTAFFYRLHLRPYSPPSVSPPAQSPSRGCCLCAMWEARPTAYGESQSRSNTRCRVARRSAWSVLKLLPAVL